jgi:hypothetical protein
MSAKMCQALHLSEVERLTSQQKDMSNHLDHKNNPSSAVKRPGRAWRMAEAPPRQCQMFLESGGSPLHGIPRALECF